MLLGNGDPEMTTPKIVTLADDPSRVCLCVARHAPSLVGEADGHHVIPQSWGGKSVPENMVICCPNAHRLVHALLNQYVHAKGTPPPEILRRYSRFTRKLAKRAIDAVGGTPPRIFTLAHGAHA